jgi:hypothetical protein
MHLLHTRTDDKRSRIVMVNGCKGALLYGCCDEIGRGQAL